MVIDGEWWVTSLVRQRWFQFVMAIWLSIQISWSMMQWWLNAGTNNFHNFGQPYRLIHCFSSLRKAVPSIYLPIYLQVSLLHRYIYMLSYHFIDLLSLHSLSLYGIFRHIGKQCKQTMQSAFGKTHLPHRSIRGEELWRQCVLDANPRDWAQ